MANVLKEAKKLRKQHPNMSWQALVKKAGKAVRSGSKVGAKKKPVKRKTTVTVKVGKPATRKKAAAPARKKSSSKSNTMSHKKRHHKVGATHHRRRRVSGVATGRVGTAAMMLLGGVAGGVAATAFQRVMPNANPKMIGMVQVAAGMAGAVFFKQPLLKGVGFGVGTAGAVALSHQYGLLKGVEDMMGGISNYQTLAGIPSDQYMVEAPGYQDYQQPQHAVNGIEAVG